METRTDILNELKLLSPTIAALEKVNVFTVPGGYFEYLGADILMGIENDLNKSSKKIYKLLNTFRKTGRFTKGMYLKEIPFSTSLVKFQNIFFWSVEFIGKGLTVET